jgi:hypothetical protein
MTRFKDTYDLLVTITAGKPSLPMMIGEFGVSNATRHRRAPSGVADERSSTRSCPPVDAASRASTTSTSTAADGTDTCLEDLVSSGGLAVWQNRIADDTKFARNIAGTFTSGQKLPIPS